MAPPTQKLNLDVEAISGICGSISIACWVVVFSPQIIENFKAGSTDGLSTLFIIVWLLGDIFNILGAVLQGVLPTMVILAFYYTIADIVLLIQCFYYRGFTWRDPPARPSPIPVIVEPTGRRADERTALLTRDNVSQYHHHPDWQNLSPAVPLVPETARVPQRATTTLQTVAWNSLAVLIVCAAGMLGWFLGRGPAPHGPEDGDGSPGGDGDGEPEFNVLGQVFGYLCAAAYIGSRVPQLVLNWRRKSTGGLSMLFFLFACLGNTTYVMSILAYDPKCGRGGCADGDSSRLYGRYVLVNLSWLAGSFLTLLLDLVVFAQHFAYSGGEGETDGMHASSAAEQAVARARPVGRRSRDSGDAAGAGSRSDRAARKKGRRSKNSNDQEQEQQPNEQQARRTIRPLLTRGDSTF